jgi:histidinol-phosphate/aromatic aminotransferase/cobyric acid decarboxylase-like protein
MRVILDPGDVIINTPPTFGMYAFDCAVNGKVPVVIQHFSAVQQHRFSGISLEITTNKTLIFLGGKAETETNTVVVLRCGNVTVE